MLADAAPELVAADERLAAALRGAVAAEPLPIRVSGSCMHPALVGGEAVDLVRCRVPWPGDVVVFRAPGRLVVHRVIGYRPRLLGLDVVTQSDRTQSHDAPLALRWIVGRVRTRVTARERVAAFRRFAGHVLARMRSRIG